MLTCHWRIKVKDTTDIALVKQDSLPLTLRGNIDQGSRPYDHSGLVLAGERGSVG